MYKYVRSFKVGVRRRGCFVSKTTPRSPIFRRNEPSAVMSGLFVEKPVIQHEKGSDGSILLHACTNERRTKIRVQ